MLTLIIGGSRSGKSLLGETIALHQQKGKLFYIATMQNNDSETELRVKNHQMLRQGKNFITIEKPLGIDSIEPVQDATYLLECMSNLVANEMYNKDGAKDKTATKVLADITKLASKSDNVIIVTNDVFSDITVPDEFCIKYLQTLSHINCELAHIADVVIESVVGIPIYYKGERF